MKDKILTMFREFTFEAAHRMPWLPTTHKCHNMHGHSYRVRLELATVAFAEGGWTRDWGDIDTIFKTKIQDALDHRILNDVDGLSSPTCENLATWIAERLLFDLPELSVVTVHEGPRSGVVLRLVSRDT